MPATERGKSVLALIMQGAGIYIEQTTLEGRPVDVICRRFGMPDGTVDVFPLAVVVNDDVMGLLALPGDGWTFVRP